MFGKVLNTSQLFQQREEATSDASTLTQNCWWHCLREYENKQRNFLMTQYNVGKYLIFSILLMSS